ncbi:unnamed protein product [Brassica oleracea]
MSSLACGGTLARDVEERQTHPSYCVTVTVTHHTRDLRCHCTSRRQPYRIYPSVFDRDMYFRPRLRLEIHGNILAFLLIKLSHLLLEPFPVFR